MSINDLEVTGKKIMKQIISNYKITSSYNKEILESIIKIFAQTYHHYQKNQPVILPHKNFHSSRDFYWMIKSFSILVDQKGIMTVNYSSIFEKAIDFNFSGIYTNKSNSKFKNDKSLKTSNTLMKEYFRDFLNKSDQRNKIPEFIYNTSKSKVLPHITRVLESNLGRYLLLFVDQSYTIQLLLENLKQ
jgi:hypothetical protein